MTTQDLQLMLLDIDGILTRHQATPTDVLTAAQALAVSAIGDLVNKSVVPADNNVQCSMVNGQCSMVNVQCSMANVQWSMFNVQWPMFNQPPPSTASPTSPPTKSAPPSTPASTKATAPTGKNHRTRPIQESDTSNLEIGHVRPKKTPFPTRQRRAY